MIQVDKKPASVDEMQAFERRNLAIQQRYLDAKRENPLRFDRRLDLSWSIWMFGTEPIEASLERLVKNHIEYVEIKGDHWTKNSGIEIHCLRSALQRSGVKVSGTCGMFSEENSLSSPSIFSRQNAIEYIQRELNVLAELAGHYLIVVPTAVGSPQAKDAYEMARSVETLRKCGDSFQEAKVKAAIEPIRSSEVSLIHTVSDAIHYLDTVDHPAINSINGDVYHMSMEETNIGEAILLAGDRLANLHLADTNRDALGTANLDLDTVIMAAYLVGMNQEGRFVTPEPLGPFANPYVLSNGPCNVEIMNKLVSQTVSYFREREEVVRSL